MPKQFWVQVLFPMIIEEIECLSTKLITAQYCDYENVKEVVLKELKLLPAEYKSAYNTLLYALVYNNATRKLIKVQLHVCEVTPTFTCRC